MNLSKRIAPWLAVLGLLLLSACSSGPTVRIDADPARREEMLARAKRTSVPQIFIGDTHVGGFDDMVALDRAGGLDRLLATD